MKRLFLLLCVAVFLLCSCSMSKEDGEKVQDLDFTVVQEAEIPPELLSLIEEKKTEAMKHTWTNGDYLYVIIGYGEQKTSGYSIIVEDLYLTSNAICVNTELLGPGNGEETAAATTCPYMVLKLENLNMPVVFE